MSEELERIRAFVEYASGLEGDEKGEAQVFCDRLFQAFGHAGYNEAGATLEYRVKRKGQATKTNQDTDLELAGWALWENGQQGGRF